MGLFSRRKLAPSTGFSEFIRNASSGEKKKVYEKVLKRATERQNALSDRVAQDVSVEPREGGRWAVQTDGTRGADSLHDRKSDAVARARDLAGNGQAELIIKNEGGKIVEKDGGGSNPRRTKG